MNRKLYSNDHPKFKHLKWLCISKDINLSFEARFTISVACFQWFKLKSRVTITSLRRLTGLRIETVRSAIADLVALRLLEEKIHRGRAYYCPVFQESAYLKKKTFDPDRWWVGIHSRKVVKVPEPKRTIEVNGCIRAVANANSMRKAVVKAFIIYANGRRRKIRTAYLAKATGLMPRAVRRILHGYKASGSITDDAKLGLAWVDSVGSESFTVSQMNAKRVSESLAKCYLPDLKKRLFDLGTKHPDLYWRKYNFVMDEDKRQYVKETRWSFIEHLITKALAA